MQQIVNLIGTEWQVKNIYGKSLGIRRKGISILRPRLHFRDLHPLCTHPLLEVRNAELYEYWSPNASCATKKDMAPENPEATTVSGFSRALF